MAITVFPTNKFKFEVTTKRETCLKKESKKKRYDTNPVNLKISKKDMQYHAIF